MTQVMEPLVDEFVLTREGYGRIEAELDRLVRVDRHEVAERIRDAKDYGELTENAEYEAAKNAQAFIEGRIMDLKKILAGARVLDDSEIRTDIVGLGSTVGIRDLSYDEDFTLTLVSAFEADPDRDRISDLSPIGRAIKGRAAGDIVSVTAPGGEMRLEILEIGK
ncbi:MAG: transcription elongation factor GreA [Armatimonadota bacterium]